MKVCGEVDVKLQTVLTFMTNEDGWPGYTPDALLYPQGKSPLHVPLNVRVHDLRSSVDTWENRKFSLPGI
jgi:hypothetical protein